MKRAALIPLVNGDELFIAHRHVGGLILAVRTGKPGRPGFRVDAIGVIAAEDVHQLRELLTPPAPPPERTDWHQTNPAEIARHNAARPKLDASILQIAEGDA